MVPPTIVHGRACVRKISFLNHDNEFYQQTRGKIKLFGRFGWILLLF